MTLHDIIARAKAKTDLYNQHKMSEEDFVMECRHVMDGLTMLTIPEVPAVGGRWVAPEGHTLIVHRVQLVECAWINSDGKRVVGSERLHTLADCSFFTPAPEEAPDA